MPLAFWRKTAEGAASAPDPAAELSEPATQPAAPAAPPLANGGSPAGLAQSPGAAAVAGQEPAAVSDVPCQPSPVACPGHLEGALPAAAQAEGPAKKQIKLFGLQLSASERGARKALVGAGVFLLVLNGFGLPFVLPKLRAFLGAPYVPMKRQVVDVLFERVLPAWAKGTGRSLDSLCLVDFGSGDGRIVAAAAGHGMRAVGYELNPYLVCLSRLRTRRLLSQAPGTGEFRCANMWSADLRRTDVLTMYGRPGDSLMDRVREKCEAELPPRAAVVSHFFDIPGWERLLVQDVHGLKLYDLGRRTSTKAGARKEAA